MKRRLHSQAQLIKLLNKTLAGEIKPSDMKTLIKNTPSGGLVKRKTEKKDSK